MPSSDFLEEMAQASPQMIEKFNTVYRSPKITDGRCWKCGATVRGMERAHLGWHKELSLRLFSIVWLLHSLAVSTGFIEDVPFVDEEE